MSTHTTQRRNFALNPGEELADRPRKRRPLIGPGSAAGSVAQHAQLDAVAHITALAEEASAYGDTRAAICFYRALEQLGKRRPDGIEAYAPVPAEKTEAKTAGQIKGAGETLAKAIKAAGKAKKPEAPPVPAVPVLATPPKEPEPEPEPVTVTEATEATEAAPKGLLHKEIAAATTLKLKKELRAIEASDMPDAVKKAKARAAINTTAP